MEQEELKRKLLGLWEKTTHNSKDLLAELFEYYFNIEYIEYKESEGKVISALCGIPYSFGYGNRLLRGLYIVSLSSEEGFRRKGILADLLNSFNNRLKDKFDFTFLVPTTALLADYYGTQGYFSSFFILEERFTPLHDFRKDYLLSLTESDVRIKALKMALLEEIEVTEKKSKRFSLNEIIDFIREIESKSTSSVIIRHTFKDLEYILSENSIRNLDWFISYDSEGKITGVAFCQKEEMKRTRVVANYVADSCSYYALLDAIKRSFPDHSLSINTFDPKYQTHSIIQQNYVSSNPEGGDLENTFNVVEIPFNINKLLQPLGMVRLLNFEKIIQYIAETRSDLDFKLHIRDLKFVDDNGNPTDEKSIFVVKNGKFTIEKFDEIKNDRTVLNLNVKELSELLLRKNDSSNLIMEAFGIPRLNLQIRLLPC